MKLEGEKRAEIIARIFSGFCLASRNSQRVTAALCACEMTRDLQSRRRNRKPEDISPQAIKKT